MNDREWASLTEKHSSLRMIHKTCFALFVSSVSAGLVPFACAFTVFIFVQTPCVFLFSFLSSSPISFPFIHRSMCCLLLFFLLIRLLSHHFSLRLHFGWESYSVSLSLYRVRVCTSAFRFAILSVSFWIVRIETKKKSIYKRRQATHLNERFRYATMFIAGFDTFSAAVAVMFFFLSRNFVSFTKCCMQLRSVIDVQVYKYIE